MAASGTDLFVSQWRAYAHSLGLRVLAPFPVTLADGRSFTAPVLLQDFGARNGMLLFPHYEQFELYVDAALDAGYGFSVLSEPDSVKPPSDTFIEMLRDWGWSGVVSEMPDWLRET